MFRRNFLFSLPSFSIFGLLKSKKDKYFVSGDTKYYVDSNNEVYLVETSDKISYYKNGELHREDGPAVEWANGKKEYWLNGRFQK